MLTALRSRPLRMSATAMIQLIETALECLSTILSCPVLHSTVPFVRQIFSEITLIYYSFMELA